MRQSLIHYRRRLSLFQGLNYLGDAWLSQTLLAVAGFKIRLKDNLKVAILGVIGNHIAPFVGSTILIYNSYKKLEIPSAVISFLVSAWIIFVWFTYFLFFFLSLLFLPDLFFNFISSKIIFASLAGLILILSVIFALSGKDVLTFYFSFLVFGFQSNFALLVFGYSISLVLTAFTLMPGVPGVMETSLVVVFIKLGFPSHIVLFASLLFRLFSYWLPLPVGVFSYWRLKKAKEKE